MILTEFGRDKTKIVQQDQKQDFLKIIKWTNLRPRQGQHRKSHAFSLETETRKDENKFYRFQICCDKTRPETSGKMNKQTSPRPELINNQNWSETKTIMRVLVSLVAKPRGDLESHPTLG